MQSVERLQLFRCNITQCMEEQHWLGVNLTIYGKSWHCLGTTSHYVWRGIAFREYNSVVKF